METFIAKKKYETLNKIRFELHQGKRKLVMCKFCKLQAVFIPMKTKCYLIPL